MKQTKPYKRSFRGRLEAVATGLVAVMKRTGAGSIAIAIGAMGAGALLATTLIFPPTPVQKVFQSPSSGAGNQTPFGRPERVENEGAIEISTRESGPGTDPDGKPDGDADDSRVLAAAVEAGDGSEVTVVSSSGGGQGSVVKLSEDEATPGEEPDGNTTAPPNDTEEPKNQEAESDKPAEKAAKDQAKEDKKAEKAAEKAAKDQAKEDKKAEKAAEKAENGPGKSGKTKGKSPGAMRAADARPRFD